ncbi:MAG: PH domain-containing protein [Acidimicrobiales bacterium]
MATPSDPGRGPASVPRRLHPASPVLDVSSFGRQLLAPGVFALGTGGVRLLLLGVALVLALRVLAWWRRTYVLDDGVLRVESGLLARSQQIVPCERVQQVNLVQKLRHRALGVAVLEVRTAVGGGGSGITLDVLSTAEAEELRAALLQAKARVPEPRPAVERGPGDEQAAGDGAAGADASGTVDPAPAWEPRPWPVVELRYGQLALAGITGVQLLVVFAFAATALQFAGDFSWDPLAGIDVAAVDLAGPLLLGILIVGILVVWLGTAAAVSIFTDADYRLVLVGDELQVSRGLLDRKEASLPLARVQAVRVAASAPRRLLGMVSVRIQSAGVGSGSEESRVAIPILPVTELDRVLALVLPGATLPALRRPPPAALRRALVRRMVPATALALLVTLAVRPWGPLALVLVPMAGGLGVAAYRGLGHALTERFLVARSGSFNRQTVVVPVERTQSGSVRANPWQRRAGLATLAVDLAGPGPSPQVPDELAATAEDLLAGVVGSREAERG